MLLPVTELPFVIVPIKPAIVTDVVIVLPIATEVLAVATGGKDGLDTSYIVVSGPTKSKLVMLAIVWFLFTFTLLAPTSVIKVLVSTPAPMTPKPLDKPITLSTGIMLLSLTALDVCVARTKAPGCSLGFINSID